MIIDAHVHIGKSARTQMRVDGEFLVRVADEVGFDKICCTDLTALFYDMHEGNRLLYEEIRRFPDRIVGYATLHSTRFGSEAIENLARCYEVYGMKGLKVYSTPEASFAEPWTVPILEKCVEFGWPVLAHSTPAECEYLLTRVPECKLMMAHAGSQPFAFGDWNRAIMVAERFRNLYLDTTSSTIDAGFVEKAVAALGPTKIIFGTDTPLLDPYMQKTRIEEARISQEARELIMGGNIQRLMGIAG
jgi:uncharacterized protein